MIASLGLISFLATPSASAAGLPYPDLDTYFGNFEAVYQMAEAGVFTGYPDGTFAGSANINRAELSKVLVLASGVMEEDVAACAEGATKTFSDVPEDWYTDYVYCAQAKAWINGDDGASTFRPADDVKVAEGFKMILESQVGTPPQIYWDTYWYDPYVNYLAEQVQIVQNSPGYYFFTYISGYVGTLDDVMNRGAVAELLYRNSIYYPGAVAITDQSAGYYENLGEDFSFIGEYYGFSIAHAPLLGVDPEDVYVFVHNYAGAYNEYYTSYEFYYPTADGSGEEGRNSIFSVEVYSPEYADWSPDADLSNYIEDSSGRWITFSCAQEVAEELEDIRSQACNDGLEGLGLESMNPAD